MSHYTNFRILNPVTATTREVAEVLNRTVDGKLNSTGHVSVSSGTTSTVVTDPRVSGESTNLFGPVNTHFYNLQPYTSAKSKGSFTISHNSHGTTADVEYVVIG